MWPEPSALALLLLLGGWAAVDGTSVGQLLISRPLFAATLAGWAVGAPEQGLLVGVVLEALHLGVLPVGASRYPESGPPAVVAGAAYALAAPASAALLGAVAFALLYERVAGASVHQLRQWNRRLVALHGRTQLSASELQRRHLGALALDALRGVLLTALGLAVLPPLLRVAYPGAAGLGAGASLLAVAAVAALLGACVHLFADRLRIYLVGAAVGLLVVWIA